MRERPLTPNQIFWLDKICRTNGGGVSANGHDLRTIMSLHRRGLVQGKAGMQHRVVHTREGLDVWRALKAEGGTSHE